MSGAVPTEDEYIVTDPNASTSRNVDDEESTDGMGLHIDMLGNNEW